MHPPSVKTDGNEVLLLLTNQKRHAVHRIEYVCLAAPTSSLNFSKESTANNTLSGYKPNLSSIKASETVKNIYKETPLFA